MRTLILIVVMLIAIPMVALAKTVTYYSPQTNLEKIDLHWLAMAQTSPAKTVYVAMYSFTDKHIARELIHLAHHGVKVYIYRDDKQMKDRTDITWMLYKVPGIQVRAKDDRGFWNIMHDKIFIIPGVVYREGSANWSPSAEGANDYHGNSGHNEQQDNNATYITNPTEIKQALRQFQHLWSRPSNIPVN
ncbi:MAG: phospholipase D-like domain-containing protein [Phycisphaerae bacterium]